MTPHVTKTESSNVNIVTNDSFAKKKNYDMNAPTQTTENINVEYATCAFYEQIIAKDTKKPTRILKGSNVTHVTNPFAARTSTIDTANAKFVRPTKSKKKKIDDQPTHIHTGASELEF